MTETKRHPSPLLHALAIIVLTAAVYSNTLSAPFHFDDYINIVENPVVKKIPSYFDSPLKEGAKAAVDMFFKSRYMGYLSFAVNYKLHDQSTFGYHAFNTFVHMSTALLVYWIIVLTFKTPRMAPAADNQSALALITALIFAAHPLNTQAVTYIVQRLASMCTMFALLSFALYVKFRLMDETKGALRIFVYASSVISMAAAMFTKEIAFTVPFMIAVYEFMFFNGPKARRAYYVIPLMMTMVIVPLNLYITLRDYAASAGGSVQWMTRLQSTLTRYEYFLTETRVAATYLRLLILPVNQNLDYDYAVSKTLTDSAVIRSILLHITIAASGVWMLIKSGRFPLLRISAFGILWFYSTASVESSVMPIEDVIFEHRAYMPGIGMLVAIMFAAYAVVRDKTVAVKKAALAVIAAIILIFAVAAYLRNNVWRTEFSLWEDVVNKSPGKARPHLYLANVHMKRGEIEKAEQLYKKAVEIDPLSEQAHINLGVVYENSGDFGNAETHYQKAAALVMDKYAVLERLGGLYIKTGEYDKATEYIGMSLKEKPDNPYALTMLCRAYRYIKNFNKAVDYCASALSIAPDNADANIELGLVYYDKGDFDNAAASFSSAVRLAPGDAMALNNLGASFFALKQYDKAISYYKKAAAADPEYYTAYFNLGEAYLRIKQPSKAIEYLEIYLAKDPDNAEARAMMSKAYAARNKYKRKIR